MPEWKNIHPKQIPTKLCIIRAELWETGTTAIELLMNCLLSEPNSSKQKNNIIAAAFLFERISCFVYRGKDGSYRKPPVKKYYREIFKNYAETPEEVFIRTEKYGVSPEKAEHIHKLIWQTADLICPMIACLSEQAFVSEYAYAIEYVINHNGNLPKPKISCLFPTNYTDYHYNESIAKEISEALKPFCCIL